MGTSERTRKTYFYTRKFDADLEDNRVEGTTNPAMRKKEVVSSEERVVTAIFNCFQIYQKQEPQSNPAAGASLSSTAAASTAVRDQQTVYNNPMQQQNQPQQRPTVYQQARGNMCLYTQYPGSCGR